jgi:sec-independent protein translocase protein TatA
LLLVVLIILGLVFFGGNRLPEVGKGLGDTIRNLKDALKDDEPKK